MNKDGNKSRQLIRLTNNIYRCTQVYIDKKLKDFNLTTGTYPYLLVLNKYPGISQNQISRELNVDKSMSARSIRRLMELGYIRKKENQEDTRAYKLYITDKAKYIIPEIFDVKEQWIDILVAGSNEEQTINSIKFLQRALKNAKKYRTENCGEMKKYE